MNALSHDGARRRFDDACEPLRVDLHRFCTRMTGSPCDGEDVLQDALVHAFDRFAELRDGGAFRAWVFRIAHNRCIDFLRGRRRFDALDEEAAEETTNMDNALDDKLRVERALAAIVTELPPRERACVMLKDVLDLSLEETAEITGTSLGAVKAALHRGRAKVEHARPTSTRELPAEQRVVIEQYLAAFNRRDWGAVQAMLSEEAHLEVVNRSEGPFRDACYFVNHERLRWNWRLALAHVDGTMALVRFREVDSTWVPQSVVQLSIANGKIARVRDFIHVEYLLSHCVVTSATDTFTRSPACAPLGA